MVDSPPSVPVLFFVVPPCPFPPASAFPTPPVSVSRTLPGVDVLVPASSFSLVPAAFVSPIPAASDFPAPPVSVAQVPAYLFQPSTASPFPAAFFLPPAPSPDCNKNSKVFTESSKSQYNIFADRLSFAETFQ